MRLISFNGIPVSETRKVFFLRAFDRFIETSRIVAFGKCNFRCYYCKRGPQLSTSHGCVFGSRGYRKTYVFSLLEEALRLQQRIRLSGGDPSCYLSDSLMIGEWARSKGVKVSICHNGSSLDYVQKMLPYLEYASIDLKGSNAHTFSMNTGIAHGLALGYIATFIDILRFLSDAGILTEIRVCVTNSTNYEELFNSAKLVAQNCNISTTFLTIRNYSCIGIENVSALNPDILHQWIRKLSTEFSELKIGYRQNWEDNHFEFWESGSIKSY